MIRCAVIDDDAMLMQGMVTWFNDVTDIGIVATSTTVEKYLTSGADADVALLDLNLRDHSDPVVNVKRLVRRGLRVLMVSTIGDKEHVIAAVEAGASGYITKSRDLDGLVEAIRVVASGQVVLSPELAFIFSRDRRLKRPRLSERESELLDLYASGMKLEAAARRMGISAGAARTYLGRIKEKYAAVDRPAPTKIDLANRQREDRLELDGLPETYKGDEPEAGAPGEAPQRA